LSNRLNSKWKSLADGELVHGTGAATVDSLVLTSADVVGQAFKSVHVLCVAVSFAFLNPVVTQIIKKAC
jgi:hypothetical protein